VWQIFERAAANYEAWYASPQGRRAERAECALLDHLLSGFADVEAVLEIGCGTGHFTAWMSHLKYRVVGLDRSAAMLAELRRLHPDFPVVLSDAHRLPFADKSFDVSCFVTALEFIEHPHEAVAEAVRVSRQGSVFIVLNRWSSGGLSRRWGRQAEGQILGAARDYSKPQLCSLVKSAASNRMPALRWQSVLFPFMPAETRLRLPFGDVIGLAVSFSDS
jgi:ubiquinone/menaquinone biosynthesis C-methylase UbiE